jgi:hypothetical protein
LLLGGLSLSDCLFLHGPYRLVGLDRGGSTL